jgi:hypothetical protein
MTTVSVVGLFINTPILKRISYNRRYQSDSLEMLAKERMYELTK